jgi:predicted nucleotidyltransferase
MIDEDLIQQIADRIVTHVEPDKVVLFGSWAWGEPDADSDLDILVVKESSLRRDKRAREVRQLFASRRFPLDVVVYTPHEVEQCLRMKGSFVKYILDQGRVLYERKTH